MANRGHLNVTRHVPMRELRGGTALPNWLEFVLDTNKEALLTVGTRCYSVHRIAPLLSKGKLGMKKPSTQIVDLIDLRTGPDGTATLSAEDCAQIKRLTKAIDRRDQQLRKGKHLPAKKKARKVAR